MSTFLPLRSVSVLGVPPVGSEESRVNKFALSQPIPGPEQTLRLLSWAFGGFPFWFTRTFKLPGPMTPTDKCCAFGGAGSIGGRGKQGAHGGALASHARALSPISVLGKPDRVTAPVGYTYPDNP